MIDFFHYFTSFQILLYPFGADRKKIKFSLTLKIHHLKIAALGLKYWESSAFIEVNLAYNMRGSVCTPQIPNSSGYVRYIHHNRIYTKWCALIKRNNTENLRLGPSYNYLHFEWLILLKGSLNKRIWNGMKETRNLPEVNYSNSKEFLWKHYWDAPLIVMLVIRCAYIVIHEAVWSNG